MPMYMMQIRHMRMGMRLRVVAVQVAVRAGGWLGVGVQMVSVGLRGVVAVGMFVLQHLVRMGVAV